MSATTTLPAEHNHESHPGGLVRWLTTTNHKDIGTMYLTFSLIMFFIGGLMILAVRAELFQPGLQLMKPEFFNQLIGVHALVMIFAGADAGGDGFCQLDDSADDRRARHGVAAPQQLGILAAAASCLPAYPALHPGPVRCR